MTVQADFTEGQTLQSATRDTTDKVTSHEQGSPISIFCQFYHPAHGHVCQKWSLWHGDRGEECDMYEESNMETYIPYVK